MKKKIKHVNPANPEQAANVVIHQRFKRKSFYLQTLHSVVIGAGIRLTSQFINFVFQESPDKQRRDLLADLVAVKFY